MLEMQLPSLNQMQVPQYYIICIFDKEVDFTRFAWNTLHSTAASGTPFFLYLAFQHTHRPQFASEKFTNTTVRGDFGDALTELDWAVGQVLETIKSSGVEDNTLIFFTADNGWVE